MAKIPYKIYLGEDEIPKQWYNVRADMKTQHRPMLNPATHKPVQLADLEPVFCTELAKQELNERYCGTDHAEQRHVRRLQPARLRKPA